MDENPYRAPREEVATSSRPFQFSLRTHLRCGMIDSPNMLILAVVVALQLLGPAYFLGRAIRNGELRVRFSLRAVFALVTVAAVSFGIIRLPLPWPVKGALLWGFLVCAVGLALARRPQTPWRPVK